MVTGYYLKGSRGVTSAVLAISCVVEKSQYMHQHITCFRFMMLSFFVFFPAYQVFQVQFFFFFQSLVLNVTQEYLTVDVKTVMSRSNILQNYVSWLQETLQLKTNKKPPIQTPQTNPPKPKYPTKQGNKKASGSSLASCSAVVLNIFSQQISVYRLMFGCVEWQKFSMQWLQFQLLELSTVNISLTCMKIPRITKNIRKKPTSLFFFYILYQNTIGLIKSIDIFGPVFKVKMIDNRQLHSLIYSLCSFLTRIIFSSQFKSFLNICNYLTHFSTILATIPQTRK